MALSFQGHVHHDIAREWFESLDDRDDAVCAFAGPRKSVFCG